MLLVFYLVRKREEGFGKFYISAVSTKPNPLVYKRSFLLVLRERGVSVPMFLVRVSEGEFGRVLNGYIR